MNRILKEAARRIAEGEDEYSCVAVGKAENRKRFDTYLDPSKPAYKYARAISPDQRRTVTIYDFDKETQLFSLPSKEAQNHRVIALLMVGEAWDDLEVE